MMVKLNSNPIADYNPCLQDDSENQCCSSPYFIENNMSFHCKGSDYLLSEKDVQENLLPKYLTQNEILGENAKILWSDLSIYDCNRNETFRQKQIQFKRSSGMNNSLVIEPVGIFF